ncbi:enoyl-CoA hydratase/isomerase family protein [Thalassotalea psychrophila]|uniref:Enoyl-CoA hydratase/isomerase family protein n=1 Tax=Thalassotalea psychrophila TaxID=3065647 RepID=A0ABY9U166_9GAMM|nr:enoyl-CoA hydratase/isomerase family protein [Colwelliaceae bacterium SQ149]
MKTLPDCEHLLLNEQNGVLAITLNRPEVRNAMNLALVNQLMTVFTAIEQVPAIKVVVLRGANGNFCAGGDLKDMANARKAVNAGKDDVKDPFYQLNRAFGQMISQINAAPQVVITLLEGIVLGGGFGLACISDIAIADSQTQFGLPETRLGLPPAQIAPFVVERIGLTQARRIMLTGARFDGVEAKNFGVVHFVSNSNEEMSQLLAQQLAQIQLCAPNANRTTKRIMLSVGKIANKTLLDNAAQDFSMAIQSAEGIEGTNAFIEKRPANWVR